MSKRLSASVLTLFLLLVSACGQPPAPAQETPPVAAPLTPAPAPEPAPAPAPEPAAGESLLDPTSPIQGWNVYNDNGSTIKLVDLPGENGKALGIEYNIGTGNWLATYKDLSLDLGRYKGIRFRYKGEGSGNSLEFKIEDADGSQFGMLVPSRSNPGSWTTVEVKYTDLAYWWGGDKNLNLASPKVHFAVSVKDGDQRGSGKVLVDQLELIP